MPFTVQCHKPMTCISSPTLPAACVPSLTYMTAISSKWLHLHVCCRNPSLPLSHPRETAITARYRERQWLLLSGLLVIPLWTFPYGSTPLAAAHVVWYDRCQRSRLTSARLVHPSTQRRKEERVMRFSRPDQSEMGGGGCFLARRPSGLINGVFGTNRLQHQCKSL